MTIAIAIASTTGVVIGADSRTTAHFVTQAGGLVTRSVTDFAEKAAILNHHVAAATFGWAGACGRLLDYHMRDFSQTLDLEDPLEVVVPKLSAFSEHLYGRSLAAGAQAVANQDDVAFGFLTGGRRSDGTFGVSMVLAPGARIGDYSPSIGSPMVVWQGMSYPLARWLKGADPRIPFDAVTRAKVDGYEYRLSLGDSLQEMVDFACFAMKLTVDTERFTNGIAIEPNGLDACGPPFDIALVSDKGAEWLARKKLRVRP